MPRFRYDKLIYLAWSRFLPLSLNYLLFFVGVRCFVFSHYVHILCSFPQLRAAASPRKSKCSPQHFSEDCF